MRFFSHGVIALLLLPVLFAPAGADDPGAAAPWIAPMPPDLGMPQVQIDRAYEPVAPSPSYVVPGNHIPQNYLHNTDAMGSPTGSPAGSACGCTECNQQGTVGIQSIQPNVVIKGRGGGQPDGCSCGGAATATSGGRLFSRERGAGCDCGNQGYDHTATATSGGRLFSRERGAGCDCGDQGCDHTATASSGGRLFSRERGAGCDCGDQGCDHTAMASSGDLYHSTGFETYAEGGYGGYYPSGESYLDDCDAGMFDDPFCPRWTFGFDLMFLKRSSPEPATLLEAGGAELFNAEDFGFDFEAGPRLSLMRHGIMNSCWDMEFVYFGVDGWDSRASFGYGLYTLIADSLGGPTVDTVNLRNRSELDSFELNFHRSLNSWLTLLAGFRHIELDDEYSAFGSRAGFPYGHEVEVDNHLWGVQVGLDAQLFCRGRFYLDGIGKVGLYSCKADQHSAFSHPNYADRFASAKDDSTAFVGELGFMGNYQLSDRLTLRAGYQMMWINGVALAPEQIPVTDLAAGTATLDTDGSPFYHGFVGGFEWCW